MIARKKEIPGFGGKGDGKVMSKSKEISMKKSAVFELNL